MTAYAGVGLNKWATHFVRGQLLYTIQRTHVFPDGSREPQDDQEIYEEPILECSEESHPTSRAAKLSGTQMPNLMNYIFSTGEKYYEKHQTSRKSLDTVWLFSYLQDETGEAVPQSLWTEDEMAEYAAQK